ncbi:MAG: hypothetical protein ACKPEY_17840 [Planctomycetota bacterium]
MIEHGWLRVVRSSERYLVAIASRRSLDYSKITVTLGSVQEKVQQPRLIELPQTFLQPGEPRFDSFTRQANSEG